MNDMKESSTGLNSSNSSETTSADTTPKVDRETQIMQQAELLGIPTAGKTIDQIVDEILSRTM